MALRNEKRYIIWNASDEEVIGYRARIDKVLATIPKEYENAIMEVSNLLMDLGASHYRRQVRMMVNGEVFAFLKEEQ